MRRRANWVAGLVLLVGAAPAAAQTGTVGSGPIPKSNKTLAPAGGAKAGAGGLNLSAPIPKAGGATTGGTFAGFGGSKSGTGTTGTTGTGTAGTTGTGSAGTGGLGGFGLGGTQGGTGLSTGDEVTLLAEARLIVTQLESTGNLVLDRRESMLLTLLVYEALRQQAVQPGSGGTTAPSTPRTGP